MVSEDYRQKPKVNMLKCHTYTLVFGLVWFFAAVVMSFTYLTMINALGKGSV